MPDKSQPLIKLDPKAPMDIWQRNAYPKYCPLGLRRLYDGSPLGRVSKRIKP